MMPPGLMIAAPASGTGKTTVALGLMRAFAQDGLRVQAFKAGPDYIDPAFHGAATGRASFNLDTWAMDAGLLDATAARAAGADLIVAEAAMGLFDGVARPGALGRGTGAELAARMGWPVVLVVDAGGQAQTAGAVALGCAQYPGAPRLAGVILNRLASGRHERLARAGLEAAGIPVLGALPRRPDLALPERHLGLVQAGETADLSARLDALADFLRAHADLAAIRAVAPPAVPGPPRPPRATDRFGPGCRVFLCLSASAGRVAGGGGRDHPVLAPGG